MYETERVYSKWHQHNLGNPIRAHSSFLNIGHKEQSKQHWKSQDLLRLDTRLCCCQMPSDKEALAPGPSQKGKNQSVWRSYYVLGTARCLMYLHFFDCIRPLWGIRCLTRWFGTLRLGDSETEWLGQGLKAGMWLSRKRTQHQPSLFLSTSLLFLHRLGQPEGPPCSAPWQLHWLPLVQGVCEII